jgi:aerobic-type carbon monoxide dehydrogenase small subunit (CoxS/CutS family)
MEQSKKIYLALNVNGSRKELLVEPRKTLLEVLREDLGLTGAKEGCGVGGCGTCTVLMNGKPVRGCLTLAVEAENKDIQTIEGLADSWPGNRPEQLHPIQEAFVESHGIQCGYCSPGMILTAKALLDEKPSPSDSEIREALSGQVCRCTGYAKIVDSVRDAATRLKKAEDVK